jgi:hypothetical protein
MEIDAIDNGVSMVDNEPWFVNNSLKFIVLKVKNI